MGINENQMPFQSPNLLKEHRTKHKIDSRIKSNTDSRLVEPITSFKKDNYEEIKVTNNSTVDLAMTDSEERNKEIDIATDPDVDNNMPSAIQYQN